jgi:hypothetical protein
MKDRSEIKMFPCSIATVQPDKNFNRTNLKNVSKHFPVTLLMQYC